MLMPDKASVFFGEERVLFQDVVLLYDTSLGYKVSTNVRGIVCCDLRSDQPTLSKK
jgi:hypothetical protein